MTQDTVTKVIKLSQDIRDAKDCLPNFNPSLTHYEKII